MFIKLSYIINFFLMLLVIYLIVGLYKIVGPLLSQIKFGQDQNAYTEQFLVRCKEIEVDEIELPDFTPASKSRYALIADKDLFRPEREEWFNSSYTGKGGKDFKEPQVFNYSQQNLRRLPIPTLSGIVIIGNNKKYAFMQGHRREEVKTHTKINNKTGARETPRIARFQIQQDKLKSYHIGDKISEYQIIDILDDMVILEKNGMTKELLLREVPTVSELDERGQQPDGGARQFSQRSFPPEFDLHLSSFTQDNSQGDFIPQVVIPQRSIPGQILESGIPRQQIMPNNRNQLIEGQEPLVQPLGQPLLRPFPFAPQQSVSEYFFQSEF
ncbi:MAG: hypothetical protein ACMUJM_24270 [bacterium]